MNKFVKIAAVAAAVAFLAGCGASPEARIRKACIADGGVNSSAQAAALADKQCSCFAEKLKGSLTPEQMEKIAKIYDAPKEKREDVARTQLDQAIFPAVLGAAKSCVAP